MSSGTKAGLVILAAVIAGPLAIYAFVTRGETREDSFADLAAAQQMIGRGWIPRCLPKSSIAIRVRSNIDSSAALGGFTFSSAEVQSLRETLSTTAGDVPALPSGRPGLPAWWPAELRGGQAAAIRTAGYEVFRCEGVGKFAVAIHWRDGHGWFWTLPG